MKSAVKSSSEIADGVVSAENVEALHAAVVTLNSIFDSTPDDSASRAMRQAHVTDHVLRALAKLISTEPAPNGRPSTAKDSEPPRFQTPMHVYSSVASYLNIMSSSSPGECSKFALPGFVAAIISTAQLALAISLAPSAQQDDASTALNACLVTLSTCANDKAVAPLLIGISGKNVLALLGAVFRICPWTPNPYVETPGECAVLVLASIVVEPIPKLEARVDALCREFATDALLIFGLKRVLSLGPESAGTDVVVVVCRCVFEMMKCFIAPPSAVLDRIADRQAEAMKLWLQAGLFSLLPKLAVTVTCRQGVPVFCVHGAVLFAILMKQIERKGGGKVRSRLGILALKELSLAGAQAVLEGMNRNNFTAEDVLKIKSMIGELAAVQST